MISARSLEIDTGIAVDEGLFADDHGINQSGLGRGPKRVHVGDDAGVNAGSPEFETVSGETGEQLYVLSFGGRQRADAVCGQITLIVESSGIAEVAREFQLDWKANAFAITEKAHRRREGVVGR